MTYTPPPGFTPDPQSGRYYRQDGIINGQQWVTWFDAASGQYEQVSYPAAPPPPPPQPRPARPQPAPVPQPAYPKTKPPALLVLCPIAALLAGLGLAFFQAGGLQLLAGAAIPAGLTQFDLDDAPVITLRKSGDLVDINNQSLPGPTSTDASDIASSSNPAASDPVTVVNDDPATWVKVISHAEVERNEQGFSFTIYHPEAREAFDRYDPDPAIWVETGWYFVEHENDSVTYAAGGPGELTVTFAPGDLSGMVLYIYHGGGEMVMFHLYVVDAPFALVPLKQFKTDTPDIDIEWYGLYSATGAKLEIGANGVPVSYQIYGYASDGSSVTEVAAGTVTGHARGFSLKNNADLTAFYNTLGNNDDATLIINFTVTVNGVDYPGYAALVMHH